MKKKPGFMTRIKVEKEKGEFSIKILASSAVIAYRDSSTALHKDTINLAPTYRLFVLLSLYGISLPTKWEKR